MSKVIIKLTIPYHAEAPHQLQGNGIFIPTLLSVVIHSLVILFIYFNNIKESSKASMSIQTTLISPEQLAEMQQQIMVNQIQNQQTQKLKNQSTDSINSNDEIELKENEILKTLANQFQRPKNNKATTNNQQEIQIDSDKTIRQLSKPIFNKSDAPADKKIDERILQKQRQYEQEMEKLAKQIDQQFEEEMRQYIESEKQKQHERIAKVNEFKKLEQQQGMIEEQNRQALQEAEKSLAELKRLQQAENSNPLSINSRATVGQNQNANSSTQPTSEFTNQIIAKIQRYFNPPLESQNKTTVLTLQLDNYGNVLSAKAFGVDERVNQAAEAAVFEASPLPIDLKKPQAYRSIRVTIRGH